MDYRLVATDLDGTLLRSDKTISGETERVLYRLDERGVVFLPSTGRAHTELSDVIMKLPFLRYAITCNGGGVYDYRHNEYVFDFTISNTSAKEVLEFCQGLPVYPTMVCDGGRYIQTDETGDIPEFVKANGVAAVIERAEKCPDLIRILDESGKGAQKVMLYPKGLDKREYVLKELRDRFCDLSITTSGPLFVEVNARGIDKGRTLSLFCEHMGIPIEETIAFGDAGNDRTMLLACQTAVVPQNGTDEIKALADYICESNDDDGVRKTIERMVL